MKKRNAISGTFAWQLIEMLEAPAYMALSLSAHRALARIQIELAHHGGNDNGKLPVTFEDFIKYGIDRHAIAPALRELEALGFIEITERGRAGNAEFRSPNKFRLTHRKTDVEPTNDWRKVKSIDEAVSIAQAARRPERKTNGGKRTETSGGTPHRKRQAPDGENPHYSPVGKSPLLSISGAGGRAGRRSAP
jgi:hypothetical protein